LAQGCFEIVLVLLAMELPFAMGVALKGRGFSRAVNAEKTMRLSR